MNGNHDQQPTVPGISWFSLENYSGEHTPNPLLDPEHIIESKCAADLRMPFKLWVAGGASDP
jgi:hypothetical protein